MRRVAGVVRADRLAREPHAERVGFVAEHCLGRDHVAGAEQTRQVEAARSWIGRGQVEQLDAACARRFNRL